MATDAIPKQTIFVRLSSKKHTALYAMILLFTTAAILGTTIPPPDGNPRKSIHLTKATNTLVMIYSQQNHTNLRSAIRRTWGNTTYLESRSIKLYFWVGLENDAELQQEVKKESLIYGDIIVPDITDSPNNDIAQVLMMFRELYRCCLDTMEYIIKTVDDVYLNLPYVFDFLPTSKPGLMMGSLYALGNIESSEKNYNGNFCFGQNYTEFLVGPTYVISVDVIKDLYLASQKIPVTLEDSTDTNEYITGLLPSGANVTLTNHQMFTYLQNITDPCILGTIVVSHNLTADGIIEAHTKLLKTRTKPCSGTIYINPEEGIFFSQHRLQGPKNPYGPSVVIRNRL